MRPRLSIDLVSSSEALAILRRLGVVEKKTILTFAKLALDMME